jgi:ribosomal protein L29
LVQRLNVLRGELAELRKQKRSQLVDMKKRSIKDEILMIETGLKKLDKA